MKNRPKRTEKLVEQTQDLEWIEVGSDWEALVLETNLIKEFRPKYNILMKDDKNYVYIKLTKNEDFPRIKIVRQVQKDGARYFGPKTSAGQVKKTLLLLQKLFQYRSCDLGIEWKGEELELKPKNRVRITKKTIAYPCLDYHIKRCAGPCIGEISPQDYGAAIEQIEHFLEGKTDEIEAKIRADIQEAVERKAFEKAAQLRDRLLAMEDLQLKQRVSSPDLQSLDALSFVFDNGKAFFNLFMVREGKLINQEQFVVESPGFLPGDEGRAPEVVESFLYQYYEKALDIPSTILIPLEIEEGDFFEAWLYSQLDRKVELHVPQRGKKRELLDLASKNALSFMKQHRARWAGFDEKADTSLEDLQNALQLEKRPNRIECYDISHLGGTDTVASMVVFEKGKPKKSDYRKFRLRTIEHGEIDDFKSMHEILKRRLRYFRKAPEGIKFRKATSKKHQEAIASFLKDWRKVEELPGELSDYTVALHEKELIGFVHLLPGEEGRFLIHFLYLAEGWRGRGIGPSLLEYALSKAKLKRAYVLPDAEHEDFYKSFGFEQVKVLPKAFKAHVEVGRRVWAYNPTKHQDASFGAKPDLIVIDGGKGQLGKALEARDAYGLKIPMIGLAKREEDIYLEGKSMPLLLPKDSEALKLLQRLRNEAHRFAIEFQRSSRKKYLKPSKN